MKENQIEPTEINVALKDFITRRLIGGYQNQFFKTIEDGLDVKVSFKGVRGPAINITGEEEKVKTAEVLILQLDQKAGVYADEKGRKRARQLRQKDYDHIEVELAELLKEAKRGAIVAPVPQEARVPVAPAALAAPAAPAAAKTITPPVMPQAPDPKSFFEEGAAQAFDEAATAGRGGKNRKKDKNKAFHAGNFYPHNQSQAVGLVALMDDNISVTILEGDGGGGKTYLAVGYAAKRHDDDDIDAIYMFRPRVMTDDGDVGAVPGDYEEKSEPYTKNFAKKVQEVTGKPITAFKKIERLIPDGERGDTHLNTITIVDEAQNLSVSEAKMLITRMGKGSKFIVMGDINQTDLNPEKMPGLAYLIGKLVTKANHGDPKLRDGMAVIHFTEEDTATRHHMMPSIVSAFNNKNDEFGRIMANIDSHRKNAALIRAVQDGIDFAHNQLEVGSKRTLERFEPAAKAAFPTVFGLKAKDNVFPIKVAGGQSGWTPS